MPRKSSLTFDRTNRRWRTRIKGKTYWFAQDYGPSVERFAVLYRELCGEDRDSPRPASVAGLVLAWLGDNGYCVDPSLDSWSKRERWGFDMAMPFVRYFGDRDVLLTELRPDCLVKFKAWCERQRWSANTIRHYVSFATRILRWGVEQGLLSLSVPFQKATLPKAKYVPRDLSIQEVRQFLVSMDASTRRRPAARIARFMLETGARSIEARLLRWRHVRLDTRTCHLLPGEHKTGRATGETRTIYLSVAAVTLLKDMKLDQGKAATPAAFVFISGTGRPYTQDGLRSIFKRQGIYPYQLRHTFAQSFVDQGGDVAALQAAMNHKSSGTTAQYSQVRQQRVLTALSQIESPERRATQLPPSDGGPSRRARPARTGSKKKSSKKSRCPETNPPTRRRSANGH